MFAMPAITYGQVLPPVMSVVAQGISSETTIGSIPSRVVYSAIALPELQNQRGGGAAYGAMPTASAAMPLSAASASQQLAGLSSPGGSPDFSVAFFAQLLGQSSEETQSQLTTTFRDAVPIRLGSPEMFELYSEVKYLPSMAAKPVPAPTYPAVEIKTAPTPEAAKLPVNPQAVIGAAVVMKNSFSYAPLHSQITYTPPVRSGTGQSRVMSQKSPEEAYMQAASRKVEAAEDNMDAAA